MSALYEKAPQSVATMAAEILCSKPRHKPLLDCKVRIGYLFARAEVDEQTGKPIGCALKKNGLRVLGLARKITLRDRAAGLDDAQIVLDADHWNEVGEDERRAILDHELTHLNVKVDKRGIVRDDLNRPIIELRPHDLEFGWFNCIAHEYPMSQGTPVKGWD